MQICIPFKSAVHFRLTEENGFDRFFKALGFAQEMQTGDLNFDQHVYIACDHPYLGSVMQKEAAAREAIKQIFNRGYNKIWNDDEVLWIKASVNYDNHEQLLSMLVALGQTLRVLTASFAANFTDKYYLRSLVVEALTWSLGGYALGAMFEIAVNREDYHLDQSKLIFHGLFISLIVFAGLIGLVYTILKGSSRCHRVIVESFILLLLALPLTGMQVVSDLNRNLDKKEPIVAEEIVQSTEKRLHRGRKGRTYYTYHLNLKPNFKGNRPNFPDEIEISSSLFHKLQRGQKIRFIIGQGWLGHQWYKEILPLADPGKDKLWTH